LIVFATRACRTLTFFTPVSPCGKKGQFGRTQEREVVDVNRCLDNPVPLVSTGIFRPFDAGASHQKRRPSLALKPLVTGSRFSGVSSLRYVAFQAEVF